MRRKSQKPAILLSTLLCLVAACIKKSANQGLPPTLLNTPSTGNSDALPPDSALGEYQPLTERNALGRKISDPSLVDAFVALALCDCLPGLQTALITSVNETRGTLPQALTPAVRREILSNPKLKILDIVPRPLDNIVGGIFADEVSVANEISTALLNKIKSVESEWNLPSESARLQLDAFVPLPGTKETMAGRWTQLVDVWSRWALIFSQGGPWSSLRNTSAQRGLLWHELLRVLAEGEYLFGISGDSKGNQWGGLTLPVDLQINNPGPFDPRKQYNQVRFLTGVHDLSLPSNNSLALARFGGERWSWRNTKIPLAEQALQWWTASRLLNRLRPANRGNFARYFFSDSLLPDDSYQLALLSLPGIDALLGTRFIDEKTRVIQSEVAGAQVGGFAATLRSQAEPQTLSLLLLALSSWSSELANTADLNVSPETAAQLKAAPKALLKGAQLVVQTLLSENMKIRGENDGTLAITPSTLTSTRAVDGELPLRDHAQVLMALISAEQSIMPSPYLKGRIAQLAAGLIQRIEAAGATSAAPPSLTETLWLRMATSLFFKAYPDVEKISEQMSKHSQLFLERLAEFERSALQ